MTDVLDNELISAIQDLDGKQETGIKLATVSAVHDDGITLTIDGADAPGEKHYKCAANVLFRPGDRVKISRDSGTYVVESVIGAPMERYPLPAGGQKGQVLAKDDDEDYQVIWITPSSGIVIPSGGSSGKVLGYKGNNELQWMDGIPSGGSAGQYLRKTNTGTEWAAAATFPASGTTGQYLRKTNTGTEWATVPAYSGPTINGTGTQTLGFFGTTAGARQSLITTSANQGYTSATASNYLNVLNNVVGILRKLGLINQY